MQGANQGSAAALDGSGLRIGLVQARFNQGITDALTQACRRELLRLGVAEDHIELVQVAGALEVPLALQALAETERFDALVARAREVCPALADAPVIDAWAGVRPRAQSRAPLLGGWPGRPGHFVANGGFKIGFGMAPAMAAIMADLVLSGEDRIPDGFRLA